MTPGSPRRGPRIRGRLVSLLAWGLLVGGVALLAASPAPITGEAILSRGLPIALLFALGGVVFGMSHPEPGAWTGAALLGWLPALVGLVGFLGDPGLATAWTALLYTAAPATLSLIGAWVGATMARARG